jgi:hypothetical protein
MDVGDAINNRRQDMQACIQGAGILAETFDDVRLFLRNDTDAFKNRVTDDESKND